MDKKQTIATIATLTALGSVGTQVANANEVSFETANTTLTAHNEVVTEGQVATAEVTATQTQKNVDEQEKVVKQQEQNVAEKTISEQNANEQVKVAEALVKEATPDNIKDAKENVSNINNDIETKNSTVEEKQHGVEKATDKVATAKKSVETAQSEVNNAQSEVKDAKADVKQAQDNLDGTGATEVIEKAKQTQVKKENDEKKVATAEKTLEEAKKEDQKRLDEIKEAEQVVATKKNANTLAKNTLEKVTNENTGAKNVLADKKADFSKAEADFNATNTLVVPAEYIEALKAYKNFDDLSEAGNKKREEAEQRLKAMNSRLVGLNKFNSNANDKGITLTLGSLTDEQKMELNFFANDLLNQIREAFGTSKVTISKGAMNFADEVSDRYVSDNWDWDKVISEGHDKEAIKELARKNGLFEGQFYENMNTLYGGRPTVTMNRAKEMIYEAFVDFLYNGMEWEHAGSVSGVTSMEDKKQYMGIALSSRKNATGIHLITVAESLIREGSTFDKTAINNPNTKVAIQARYEKAKNELNQALEVFNKTAKDLKDAQQDKEQSDKELSLAEKTLAQKNDVKVKTPEAQAILDKAMDDLVESTKENETAQKAVRDLDADIKVKEANLKTAKDILSTKQTILNDKQTKLDDELGKLAQAEKGLEKAEKELEVAKQDIETAQQLLAEAKERVKTLESAPAKLAEAKLGLETAQQELAEAKNLLETEQAKLAELTAKRDEAKTTYEMLKQRFESQEEAKKQAELERKYEELTKNGIPVVPVVSSTGNVVNYVAQTQTSVKVDVQNGAKFIDVVSAGVLQTYEAPKAISHKQLPATGTKESVLTFVGLAMMGALGFGFQKKKEGK